MEQLSKEKQRLANCLIEAKINNIISNEVFELIMLENFELKEIILIAETLKNAIIETLGNEKYNEIVNKQYN